MLDFGREAQLHTSIALGISLERQRAAGIGELMAADAAVFTEQNGQRRIHLRSFDNRAMASSHRQVLPTAAKVQSAGFPLAEIFQQLWRCVEEFLKPRRQLLAEDAHPQAVRRQLSSQVGG